MALRRVLITGCADGGLGAALAVAFRQKGHEVFAAGLNISEMSEAKSAGAHTLTLDVTSQQSINRCMEEVKQLSNNSLDILVNNAGRNYGMPVVDIDIDEMHKLFQVNVYPIITVTRAFLPLLRNAQKQNGAGILVNNTSIQSLVPLPFDGAYNASKAASAMLTSVLRLELDPFNIKVVDLKTSSVKTQIHNFKPSAARELPNDSIYSFARPELNAMFRGTGKTEGAITSAEWASGVVQALSQPNPPATVWIGGQSTTIWWYQWVPQFFADKVLKSLAGIPAMKRKAETLARN